MLKYALKICGLDRAQIEKRLNSLGELGVDFFVQESCLDARIEIRGDIQRTAFERVIGQVSCAFEDEMYGIGEQQLNQLAVELLKRNKQVLSVAESLTGGEICSRIIEVAGASANFYEGVVCYDSRSKMARLGVRKNTLLEKGAVSRETAYEMVQGASQMPATIGLATTGLAGPSGDEGKPVGLVYIGVGGGDFITVFERHFTGDRNRIRHSVTNVALFYLVRYLKGDILRL